MAFFTDRFKNVFLHSASIFYSIQKTGRVVFNQKKDRNRASLLTCPGKTQLRWQKIALILLIN